MKSREPQPDYLKLSDSALMLRFKDGDVEAFNILFSRYLTKKKYITLKLKIVDPEVADEVFQEAWEKIIDARHRYKASASFRTFFETVLKNVNTSYYRKPINNERIHVSNTQSDHEESENIPLDAVVKQSRPSTEKQSLLSQCVELLKTALLGLPSEQRESMLLKIDSGFTLEEIAKVTGVSRETTKSRLRYAVKKLKGLVPEECYE